jgi:DNA integrity scanning protein DisA with diadenylate cyclase activity
MKSIEESIGKAATKIAKDTNAKCIISIERKISDQYEESNYIEVKVTIFKKIKEKVYKKIEYETKTHKVPAGSITPIKEVLMEAITKKYIEKGERVVCIQDESMGSGYKGVLLIFDVDKIFFDISTHKLSENIDANVIETIISIALEIAKEGREGKKIGTAFVIGNSSELAKHLTQLIINPFSGLSEKVNITDPNIKETIKEFAQLDGVFIIENDGSIISTGAYINIDTKNTNLPGGFGTRHRACAALTKETSSLAIVVSQSGGSVRVLKEGRIIMKVQP